MSEFGGGGHGHLPNPAEFEMLARARLAELEAARHQGGGGRPPKRSKPGLLRRIVRFIRGGGD